MTNEITVSPSVGKYKNCEAFVQEVVCLLMRCTTLKAAFTYHSAIAETEFLAAPSLSTESDFSQFFFAILNFVLYLEPTGIYKGENGTQPKKSFWNEGPASYQGKQPEQ